MPKDFEILEHISRDSGISQREISKMVGISLGSVNDSISRLIGNEMLTLTRKGQSGAQYIVTPHGMRKKAEHWYLTTVDSYKKANRVTQKINEYIQSIHLKPCKEFVLFGSEDEIFEAIREQLTGIGIKFIHVESIERVCEMISCDDLFRGVIVWQPDCYDMLGERGIRAYNVLDYVSGYSFSLPNS